MFENKHIDQNSIQGLSQNLRHQVMSRGGFGMGILCLLGGFVRNAIAPMKPLGFAVILTIGLIFLSFPFVLKRGMSHRFASLLITFSISALALNAGIINGGIRAPVIATVVLLPFLGFISSGRWGARFGFVFGFMVVSYFLLAERYGHVFPVESPELYVYYKGAMMYFIITVTYMMGAIYEKSRDFSEEKLLKLSAELSQASKMTSLGEMASGISHEINNPLSVIVGKAELLKRKIEAGTATMENIKDDLAAIEKNGKRISKIILSMKRLSRSADSDPKKMEPLSHIVEDVLEICRERFKNHQVDLRLVDLAPEMEIECQSTQIAQVLVNLLGNAFDAVEGLPEKWVELRAEIQNGFLLVSVTDSGKGIKKEIVDKMMQPFFTTKEVGRGTGLGLSISKRIIENHGGEFIYDLISPHTRFAIKLPLGSKTIQNILRRV